MKTRKNIFRLFIALFAISFVVSCTSPQDLVETGQYDEAVILAAKKLQRRNKKKKHIVTIENAFKKATDRDMRAIKSLMNSNEPQKWVRINEIHRRIQKRQNVIEPFLPLVSKKGYQGTFRFVKIDKRELESRNKAADFYYQKAESLITLAKAGDKMSAREAYTNLEKTERYFTNFKDKRTLQTLARDLGMNRVLFNMVNKSRTFIPKGFEKEILQINIDEADDLWTEYYTNANALSDFDYHIELAITDIDISPEIIRERQYIDTKEIQDGYDYVLDSDGNVMKDTLGNDIKVERYVHIHADVFETYQEKTARVRGRLTYYDNSKSQVLKTNAVNVITEFTNFAATYRGNRRALSSDSKRRLGNHVMRFPTDGELIMDASADMKRELTRILHHNSYYVMK